MTPGVTFWDFNSIPDSRYSIPWELKNDFPNPRQQLTWFFRWSVVLLTSCSGEDRVLVLEEELSTVDVDRSHPPTIHILRKILQMYLKRCLKFINFSD